MLAQAQKALLRMYGTADLALSMGNSKGRLSDTSKQSCECKAVAGDCLSWWLESLHACDASLDKDCHLWRQSDSNTAQTPGCRQPCCRWRVY